MNLPAIYGSVLIVFSMMGSSRADDAVLPMDTRGPVVNANMAVKVDEQGVQAPGYAWTIPAGKKAWMAKWIGSAGLDVAGTGAAKSQAVCVRKEVELTQPPVKVTAWITSENYLLFINGKPAARGPADAGHDFTGASSNRRFDDVRDLTPLFHQGKNTLAAELIGCNDFLFEALVEYPGGKTVTLQTDESWKGESSPYLKVAAIPVELQKNLGSAKRPLFDATAEPVGWLVAGFDDASWRNCKNVIAPAATLVASELPPLMEARYGFCEISRVSGGVTIPDKPFTQGNPVVVKGDGEFAVHFDRIMSGRCGIAVKGCRGATIYLQSNEVNSWGGRTYQIQLRDGDQYFESRDYYALGTINVVVRNATSPIEISEVSADFLSQPVEYRGSFTCSDAALNALWKSGRWSTQICMITHHLDSPQHQEPISDYGDYVIADLVNYTAMGTNHFLARQDLRKWAWVMENAKYKTFHTSYMLYWLQCLLNYYDYTGDKSIVEELAPSVHAVIDQFASYIGKNGIISEAPNYMFMDWCTVYDDENPAIKFGCHHPPAVIGQGYLTALFYAALHDAIRVSQLTNDPVDADKYEKLRRQIGAAYQRELWVPERGQYRDGKPFVTSVKSGRWLPADVQMQSFSVQNNALAVLHNLAPADQQSSIIETMVKNPHWDVTPWFMHFVFEAFDHAGVFGKFGVKAMHEFKIVPETQTVQEMGTGKGDHSHGWIASPTYQMSSKILGITPMSPGFAALAIRPTLCGLQFARGTVPTPHGDIDVDWQRQPNQLTLKISIPQGTQGLVDVPFGAAPQPELLSAGKVIWDGDHAGESVEGVRRIGKVAHAIELLMSPGTYELVEKRLLPDVP